MTASAKAGYVQGNNQNSPGNVTTGLNTIAADTTLNPAIISSFLKDLAANPTTQILNSTQACEYPSGGSTKPEGLQMAATGTPSNVTVTNNCTGTNQVNQTVNLGTSSSPALVYVKGEYDPSSNFIGMSVGGNQPITGYGIFVMEDADLSFFQSGQFTWNGIVVVTGRNVGVGFRGGSNTEIRGALIANETNGAEAGGADPSATEYQEARRWLLRVGALTAPAVADASASEPPRTADPSLGHLVGKTQWPEVTPQRHLITGSLTLTGDEPVTQDVTRTRAFRLGDVYEFKDVPPGRHRVIATVDGATVWDEKVAVLAGKDTTLDLMQSSSPVPISRFAPGA